MATFFQSDVETIVEFFTEPFVDFALALEQKKPFMSEQLICFKEADFREHLQLKGQAKLFKLAMTELRRRGLKKVAWRVDQPLGRVTIWLCQVPEDALPEQWEALTPIQTFSEGMLGVRVHPVSAPDPRNLTKIRTTIIYIISPELAAEPAPPPQRSSTVGGFASAVKPVYAHYAEAIASRSLVADEEAVMYPVQLEPPLYQQQTSLHQACARFNVRIATERYGDRWLRLRRLG